MPSCKVCKKKISSLMKEASTCRCKKLYCGLHMTTHDCSFDYQQCAKEQLAVSIVSAIPDRLRQRV